MKKINKIITILLITIYIVSLIYLIINWNNMSDVIGVHFDLATDKDYLTFDVYDKKIYSLYPYIINGILLFVVLFTNKKINKFRTGLKVNLEGEKYLRIYIQIFTYIIAIGTFIFFTSWMYCVINQCNMSILIPWISSTLLIFALFTIIPIVSFIRIKFGKL